MMKRRAGQNQPVNMGDGQARRYAFFQKCQHTAGGRPVDVDDLADPDVNRRNHERLSIHHEAQMTDQGFVEDLMHGRTIIDCHSIDGGMKHVVWTGPRQFIGDPSTLSGRADGGCRPARINPPEILRIKSEIASSGSLWRIRSFPISFFARSSIRRSALIEGDYSGIRVVGSRFSRDTHRTS